MPITREDHIRKFRQAHSNVRHLYTALCVENSHKDRCMLTFTVNGKGRGAYTKLRISNEIKSYVTYLIANSKSDISFFSNIEIGSDFSNPHLHTQIWHNDLEAVMAIRKKVIAKFKLVAKNCDITLPNAEPQQQPKYYNYVIKDYAKDLSDDEIWNLEKTKQRMRNTLGLTVRFYSKSKSKYTSKLYKMVYRTYKVLRAFADKFIDFFLENFFVKKSIRQYILDSKKEIKFFAISSFISRKNKGLEVSFLTLDFDFFFGDLISFYGFAPTNAPPILVLRLDFNLKGDVLFLLCFILFSITLTIYRLLWVLWVGLFSDLKIICFLFTIVLFVEVRCLSPPLLLFMLEKK